MKYNIILILLILVISGGVCIAKDRLIFDFPNEGWHKVESPDGVKSKKCYVPINQTSDNYTEMLIFTGRTIKNSGLNAMVMLERQLGKDRNNYRDIIPEYIFRNENDAMYAWCSRLRNTCSLERAFKGKEGIVFVKYINRMPHYSQNIFGQWSNMLALVKVYEAMNKTEPRNLIDLN